MDEKVEAQRLLREWKKESYVFGLEVLNKVGEVAKTFGNNALLVGSNSKWAQKPMREVSESLRKKGISFTTVLGARPNCPREDLYRITFQVARFKPNSIIAFGGGSTIDAVKAASFLAIFEPSEISKVLNVDWSVAGSIDPFFGTGNVTKMKIATNKDVIPVIAVQAASSSAAHLTKYSNITDPVLGQKKLIVDDAITPKKAFFDYGVTVGSPENLTLDGAMDGIAHCWEVFMGATGKDYFEKSKMIASLGIKLILKNLRAALKDDVEARVALGLGTDLGGYSIMIGGTSGPHLGSFSLVDVLSHGRACAVLNPYFTIFFSSNIQEQLRILGVIFQEAGLIAKNLDLEGFEGRALGEIVAKAMIDFNRSFGFPTTLKEAGATTSHIKRMLEAAKDSQLKMKLQNMPTPLDVDKGDIDKYMKSILKAAYDGNFKKIKIK